MKKTLTVLVTINLLMTLIVYGQVEQTPFSIKIQLLPRGEIIIDYIFNVASLDGNINISLIGSSYQRLSIKNQDDDLISWKPIEEAIQVDVTNSEVIYIQYSTSGIGLNENRLWNFNTSLPIPAIVFFTDNLFLVGIDPPPNRITVIENKPTLVMSEGYMNITYTFSESYTLESALLKISQAETYFNTLTLKGIKIEQAKNQLNIALDILDKGFYRQAIEQTDEAINIAQNIETQANEALQKINSTEALINEYAPTGKQRIIDQAENELSKAKEQYNVGNYNQSQEHSLESQSIILESNNSISIYNTALIAITLIIVLIFSINRKEINQILRGKEEISDETFLEKLFNEKLHLREDDKNVIKYILQRDGAFITDIREEFDLPKSTGWRMLRRLEEEDIIDTELIGRETYVKIKKKK